MDAYIEKMVKAYTQGLITRDELATSIAKEYAKLWARGQILAQLINK